MTDEQRQEAQSILDLLRELKQFCSSQQVEEATIETVNHPPHYTGDIECIDAMIQTQGVEAVKAFCLCNAFKYLWRHKDKGGDGDIEKAVWYLEKYLEVNHVDQC